MRLMQQNISQMDTLYVNPPEVLKSAYDAFSTRFKSVDIEKVQTQAEHVHVLRKRHFLSRGL